MAIGQARQPALHREAAVAIENDADVSRNAPALDFRIELPFVETVGQLLEHLHLLVPPA
jgi:hypothetical protein